MKGSFSLIPAAVAEKIAVTEIIQCNGITSRFGLILNESDAAELAKTRSDALEAMGRIEFSGGIINKIITAFCDSPYLNQVNYTETLNVLLEAFYYFKNETLDEMDDDELIDIMKKSFNQTCRGSVDLLMTRDLENLSRRIRFGIKDFSNLNDDLSGIFDEDEVCVNEDDTFTDWCSFFDLWEEELI